MCMAPDLGSDRNLWAGSVGQALWGSSWGACGRAARWGWGWGLKGAEGESLGLASGILYQGELAGMQRKRLGVREMPGRGLGGAQPGHGAVQPPAERFS